MEQPTLFTLIEPDQRVFDSEAASRRARARNVPAAGVDRLDVRRGRQAVRTHVRTGQGLVAERDRKSVV